MNNQSEENKKQRDAMNQGTPNSHPSSSNFKNNPERAREAGRKGGSK